MKVITSLLRDPQLRTGLIIGFSGLAFVLANILLARAFSVEAYAIVSLLIAIISLSISLGAGGLDGVVNRHFIQPNAKLFSLSLLPAISIAVASLIFAYLYYEVDPPNSLFLMSLAIVFGGLTTLGGAVLQSRQRFVASLALIHGPNLFLLLGAILAAAGVVESVNELLTIVAVGYGTLLLFGHWRIRFLPNPPGGYEQRIPASEAISYLAIIGAAEILMQLERLMIPKLISLADLATFSVVAAVVAPPFRLLQMTFGFTLLPKLRSTTDRADQSRLIIRDVGLASLAITIATVFLLALLPWVESTLLAGKYQIPHSIVIAVIVAGVIKVADSILKSIATATLTARKLRSLGLRSLLSVPIAVAAALGLSAFGTAGVVYGVAIGWLFNIALTSYVLRERV